MLNGTWVLYLGQFALWGFAAPDLLRAVERSVPKALPEGGPLRLLDANGGKTIYALRLRPADALQWLITPDSGPEDDSMAFWRRAADHAVQMAENGQFTVLPGGVLLPEPDPRLLARLATIMPDVCRMVALSPALVPMPAALLDDFWTKIITLRTDKESLRMRLGALPYYATFWLGLPSADGKHLLSFGLSTPTGRQRGWPARHAERPILLAALGLAARSCDPIRASLAAHNPANVTLSEEEAAAFMAVTAPLLRRAGHEVIREQETHFPPTP